jgi:tetratricopeptide (TPR) repeat protein
MGGVEVRFCSNWYSILALSLIAGLVSACSLDPNVRKQKDFQSGQRYFEKGQYKEAAIEFTNAIKIDPSYADAHFQLAESYLNLQQRDRAYKELARTVELRPEDYRARIAMANLLILSRNLPQAQEQADLLLKKRPNDLSVHATASNLLAAQGNIPGAIGEMQQTIALDPGGWEPYLSLALLQLRNNQPDAAEANFKKVIELNPKAMQPRLLLGTYYQSHNRPEEAEQQFRDAITLDPKTIEPRERLARLYMAEGKKAEAEGVLKQATHDLPHDPGSFLALSNFYYATGDLDRAIAEYGALYQDRPKDLQIKKKYIQLLILAKRNDEARKLDDEILKANPNDDEALVYRSQMQISWGDIDHATQTLQAVIKNAPKNSQAHYVLGITYEKQGNLEQAESEWREALRLNPNMLDAQRALAGAAMRLGDMNTLRDAAAEVIRLQPGLPDGYALRALSNINRQQYAEAETDIRKAIDVAPQSAFGYVQMGNLRFLQKQYGDAAKAYQDALDRNANSTDALRGLVSTYIAEKQIDKAIDVTKVQIGKSPNNSSFYDLLGSVLFHSKADLSGAEAAFEKSAALDKHDSDALIQLCQVLAAKGEIDKAIAVGEQSLKENPRQPNLDVLMGNLYQSKSNWKGAEDAYQSALAINSQNPLASNSLARVMLHTGENLDIALSLAQTARRELPDSPSVVDTLGWVYYRKGVYPLAINYLQEALKLQEKNKMPDNPDIDYHLGWAYEKSQQPALARQHFEHVLKVYPNYPAATEIKKELTGLKS